MTMDLLRIKNLSLQIAGNPILFDLNFTIKAGEVLALLGESGSGKTMTSLSIMRLLPEDAKLGSKSVIQFDGEDLLSLSEVQMQKVRGGKIGMIFQEPMTALNPVLTVGYQIREVLRRHLNLRGRAARDRVIELLHEVGLSDPKRHYHEYPHQLSGGMRQRVVIAMAIAAEPKLLIADEPTSALDVFTQAQILDLLHNLQDKTGMAMLFITHDLIIAKKLADHVVVLQRGNIVEDDDKKEFFTHPHHEYCKQLIHAAEVTAHPHLHEHVENHLPPLLEVDDLKVHFPIQKGLFKRTVGWVKAIDGINLKIYPGRTVAVVGESGSGKTTLAKAILQLEKPTSGTINFLDKNLTNLSTNKMRLIRQDLQIVFQDPFSSLNPKMLVGDIIAEGLVAQKLVNTDHEKEEHVDELLNQVGLKPENKHRYPHEFSGGQRQRIGIARALAVQPKLIICDEPTSALDVPTQGQILDLLQKLQQEFKLSYLFITHNIPVAAAMADEIAIMRYGKIVEYGETAQIIKNPQHPYTKELLSVVL